MLLCPKHILAARSQEIDPVAIADSARLELAPRRTKEQYSAIFVEGDVDLRLMLHVDEADVTKEVAFGIVQAQHLALAIHADDEAFRIDDYSMLVLPHDGDQLKALPTGSRLVGQAADRMASSGLAHLTRTVFDVRLYTVGWRVIKNLNMIELSRPGKP